MRILIATDAFKGTLDAAGAAAAMAAGWSSARPGDDVVCKPLSDGGPGFVAAMAAARVVSVRETATVDSLGVPVLAQWCLADGTAYVESAQVVGLHRGTDVLHATSVGLAPVLLAAIAAGASRIVVGLGGTNVNDGGAGLLGGLGAIAQDVNGRPLPLDLGPLPLAQVHALDLRPALASVGDANLVCATDVDVPLLGARGATHGFAAQKGATPEDRERLEAALTALAAAAGRRADGRDAAVALGAGAAGGLGFALLRLGAERLPGIDLVWDESRIDLDGVDLVITGEGCLDWQSMHGKVVAGVARRAQARGIPAIAIAGRVEITPRERADMGLDATYACSDLVGEERSRSDAAAALAEVAARVVRTWGR